MPIAEVGPVADTMRPIFTCADADASGNRAIRRIRVNLPSMALSLDADTRKERNVSPRPNRDKAPRTLAARLDAHVFPLPGLSAKRDARGQRDNAMPPRASAPPQPRLRPEELAYAVEPVLGARVVRARILGNDHLELPQEFFLPRRKFHRRLDRNMAVEVAVDAAAHALDPLVAQAEHLTT